MICKIMVADFIQSSPELKAYDAYDLRKGKGYAEWLIEEGLIIEPFYGFNLREFIAWCSEKLQRSEAGG